MVVLLSMPVRPSSSSSFFAGMMSRTKARDQITRYVLIVLLLIGGLIMVFPLFWLVSTSLRPAPELNLIPPRLLPVQPTLNNYARVFQAANGIDNLRLVVLHVADFHGA